MALNEEQMQLYSQIDNDLSHDSDFRGAIIRPAAGPYDEADYADWYGRVLTTHVVLLEGDEFVVGFTQYDEEKQTARHVVFSKKLVIVTDVEKVDAGGESSTWVVARNSLASMSVSASAPVRLAERHRFEWPGTLTVELQYEAIEQPIALSFGSLDPYRSPVQPSRGRLLLDALRGDLA